MASQPYVPGPCEISIDSGAGNALEFLGWSVNGAQVASTIEELDLMCDLSGSVLPFDKQFQGEHCFISFQLSVYDAAIFSKLEARRNSANGASGTPTVTAGSGRVGDFVRLSGWTFRCLLYFPYAQSGSPYAAHPDARNFLACTPVNDIDQTFGTKAVTPRVVLHAEPVWVTSGGSIYSYVTWNTSTSGRPSPG